MELVVPVLLAVVYGLLLLLWLVTALPALLAFVPGDVRHPALILGLAVAVLGWLAIPVTCLIALDALTSGLLDRRSLLPPLAIAVQLSGFGLGAVVIALVERRDDGRAGRGRPAPSAPVEPTPDATAAVEAAVRDAPVVAVPEPWRAHGLLDVRGVRAVGFADDPDSGRELMLVVGTQGSRLVDVASGDRVAGDDEPRSGPGALEIAQVRPGTANVVYRCPGIGPLRGRSVDMVGFGTGTLPRASSGWACGVHPGVDGRASRVTLGRDRPDAPRWVVGEFRAAVHEAGFSRSGRTLVVVLDAGLWWCLRPASS